MDAGNTTDLSDCVRIWLTQARGFAERYFREMARSKVGWFWSFAFPVLWYLLTVHLGVLPGISLDYGSVIKGILGISFGIFGAFTVTLVGFTGDFATDIGDKRYRKFRSLPLSPSADLVGRFISGALLGLASWSVTISVAVIDGAAYQHVHSFSLIVVVTGVLLFCLIGMIAGLLTALVIPRPQHATTIGTGFLIIAFFVTGYNGTIPSMFPANPAFLNYIPNSLATRLIAAHMIDTSWTHAGLTPPSMPQSSDFILLLAGYGGVLSIIGILAFKRYVYRTDLGG